MIKLSEIKFKKIYIVILVALVISLSLAMYKTLISKSGIVKTAAWSFKVLLNDTEITNENNTFELNLADTVENIDTDKIAEGTVAPGSQGNFKISVDASGSEVGAKYTLKISSEDKILPENLKFYTSNDYNVENKIDLETEYTNYINLNEIDTTIDHIVYWRWETNDDEENNIKDTLSNSQKYTAKISVLGVQNASMSSINITEEKYFELNEGYLSLSETYKNEFKKNVVNLVIPSKIENEEVIGIDDFAFTGLTNIKTVKISSDLEKIGDSAFRDCENIENVIIIGKVKKIDKFAFYNTKKLVSITLPHGLERIESWAFKNCIGLTTFTVPSTVNYIGESAFSGCTSLTKINIPELVTVIDKWLFLNCMSLTTISLPTTITEIREGAFAYCENMTSVNIPNINLIEDSTFYNCRSLKTIIIPKSVTQIKKHAFANCILLQDVTIKDNILIDESAFLFTIYGESL